MASWQTGREKSSQDQPSQEEPGLRLQGDNLSPVTLRKKGKTPGSAREWPKLVREKKAIATLHPPVSVLEDFQQKIK